MPPLQILEDAVFHTRVPPEIPADYPGLWAVQRLWYSLMPLLKRTPHVFVYACGRSLSLALIGTKLVKELPSPGISRVHVTCNL